MGKPGIIAFPVLLALGAITGYLTYIWFTDAIPDEGFVDSPYRKELSVSATNDTGTGGGVADETKFSKVVTIRIPDDAVTQGNPDYDPDAATASFDSLITWVNDDSTLHTATSGAGPSDPDSGELFDTGFLAPDAKYSIPASDIGTGSHQYYCTVHPYMTSTITVQ